MGAPAAPFSARPPCGSRVPLTPPTAAGPPCVPRPLRSTLDPLADRACRSLRRGLEARRALVLVGLLALLPLDLLLQRAQRLVGGAAHGAHQRGAVLEQRVRVLAGEALLQLHEGGRVGQAEQLLVTKGVGE